MSFSTFGQIGHTGTYSKIGNANFKSTFWTFKQQLALKMRMRFEIFIVLL